MVSSEDLRKVFQYIDTYQDQMIDDLRTAVAFRTVSGSYEHNGEIQKMVKWIEGWMIRLKATTSERFDIGSYSVDGKTIRLPTVILASFGKDPKKKTLCVYSRIDVKNADPTKWQTEPWKLQQKGGELFGRGACKGKVPLMSWLHAIEAYLMQKIPLPINIKFIIEGMSEMNCFGLEDFLYTQRITFLKNIDYICVNESEWLNSSIPCISYGSCGICQYEVVCSQADTGAFNQEQVMAYIFGSCVDRLGNILIPKINDDVVQITPEIEQSLDSVECDLTLIKKNLPDYMQSWNKQKILLRLWQMPSLIVQDAQPINCSCKAGGDNLSATNGLSQKFVLKIVPVQTPDRCNRFVMDHFQNIMQAYFKSMNLEVECKKTATKFTCRVMKGTAEVGMVKCTSISETRAWQENSVSPHYQAVKRATAKVFKDPPSIIKQSVDSPIILILEKVSHNCLVPNCIR